MFQFSGEGTENLDTSNPLNLRTSENVFSGGVRRETSVVSPISQEQPSMSPKQLHKELEDEAAAEKTVMNEKLDLILEEIRNQKSEVKALSETVKAVQKQTEENNAALKEIQKSSENKGSSSEMEKALKELHDIKKKMTEIATAGESSSSGRLLEEIQLLRANSSSLTEAFEKLVLELSE